MKPKIICGEKEFVYTKCKGCIHATFDVAQGIHPDYGWWIQLCNLPEEEECQPLYEFKQLTLF